jgi:protein-tyrosine phosphatase
LRSPSDGRLGKQRALGAEDVEMEEKLTGASLAWGRVVCKSTLLCLVLGQGAARSRHLEVEARRAEEPCRRVCLTGFVHLIIIGIDQHGSTLLEERIGVLRCRARNRFGSARGAHEGALMRRKPAHIAGTRGRSESSFPRLLCLRTVLAPAVVAAVSACAHPATTPTEGGNGAARLALDGVEITGVYNARQMGGLRTQDGRRVRDGVLFRSGHLVDVEEQGSADLFRLGIATVLDVRSRSEAGAAADAPWVISGRRHQLIDLPRIGLPSEQSYLSELDAVEPKLATVFAVLGAPGALPALVHCVTGRDRAGLVMTVVLLSLGVTFEQVSVDFATNQAGSADSRWLEGVFARVKGKGGIDEYLAFHRVARADLDSLRSQALE